MRVWGFSLILMLVTSMVSPVTGQVGYIEETPWAHHLLDRLQSSGHFTGQHTTIRSTPLASIISSAYVVDSLTGLDRLEYADLLSSIPEYLRFQNESVHSAKTKSGFFSNFYKDEYSFYVLDAKDLFLKLDPIFHFRVGDDRRDDATIFQNSRGLKIRGLIDDKIFFYTSLIETQKRYLNYENVEIDRINAIPGQSFFSRYQEDVFGGLDGWDHLNAQAYVGGKISKSIDVRFGHGRHFVGDGIRSMLLSDYATNYLYLQFNTRIWKFHYQNIFAELSANSGVDNPGDDLLPKKYMATHYLSFQPSDRFSIGLFESIIFGRSSQFELQYLNPVILYRSLERNLNSPDNAFLGLNVRWIPKSKYQLYGQLLVDELRVSEVFAGDGWWGNKFGYQVGLKKFDLFNIDHLDAQLEYNAARPYTYTHRGEQIGERPIASYTHYNQALAHPLGANFKELIFQLRYQPVERLVLSAIYHRASYGTSYTLNVGRNILLDNDDRLGEYGQQIGQGLSNDVSALHMRASWELMHQYYIDLDLVVRSHERQEQTVSTTRYLGLGFRANIFDRPSIF